MISMLTNFIKNKKKKEKTELVIEELKKSLLEDPKFRDEILRELEYRTGRRDFLKVGVLGLLGLSAVSSGVYAQNVSSANIDENVIREIVSDYVRDYADSIKIPKPCTVVVAQDGTGDYDVSPGEDASEVIQKAIDDAHKKGGGEVKIREGEYLVEKMIKLHRYTALIGTGYRNSILKLNTSLPYLIKAEGIYPNYLLNNFIIRDLCLDGNKRKYHGNLLCLHNVNEPVAIESVYFSNCKGICLHLKGACWNLYFKNLIFRNSGDNPDTGTQDKPCIVLESDSNTRQHPSDLWFYSLYFEQNFGTSIKTVYNPPAFDNKAASSIHIIGGKLEHSPKKQLSTKVPAVYVDSADILFTNYKISHVAADGIYVTGNLAYIHYIGGFIENWGDNNFAVNFDRAHIGVVLITHFSKYLVGRSGGHIRIGPETGNEAIEKMIIMSSAWTAKPIICEAKKFPDLSNSYGLGYTRRSGTAVIPAGSTSVTVNHGLISTPQKVLVTPRGNVGSVWVSDITAKSFKINCLTVPDTDVQVDWYAEV